MTEMAEVVAIAISLLVIVVWVLVCLHRINRKLDRLLSLFAQSNKKVENSDHADSTQTDD